jgi:heme/copper-type cytochrome/quinol oxidase subunit 3
MRAAMLLLAVVLSAFTGAWLLAMPALIYWVSQQLQISWVYLALGFAALHIVVGLVALGRLWKRLSQTKLFAESINQFQTDRAWLAGNPQK